MTSGLPNYKDARFRLAHATGEARLPKTIPLLRDETYPDLHSRIREAFDDDFRSRFHVELDGKRVKPSWDEYIGYEDFRFNVPIFDVVVRYARKKVKKTKMEKEIRVVRRAQTRSREKKKKKKKEEANEKEDADENAAVLAPAAADEDEADPEATDDEVDMEKYDWFAKKDELNG
jgi:hypothetical protein